MNAITQLTPPVESTVLAIQEGPAALMTAIIQFASNPAMDLDKFDRLIALQERTEDRHAERAFNVAFVQLQGKLPRIKRDGTLEYPTDKAKPDGPKRPISKYAKWETIDAGIRPVLTEAGFALSFKISQRGEGGGLNVSAVLRHIGGHKEIGDPFPVPLDTSGGKNNLQAYGSSLSYGKKYAAFGALNIITEDEDTDGRAETPTTGAEERVNGCMTAAELKILDNLMVLTRSSEGKLLAHHGLDYRSIQQVPAREFVRLKNSLLAKVRVLTEREAFAAKARAAEARQPQNRDPGVVGKMMDSWDANKHGARS